MADRTKRRRLTTSCGLKRDQVADEPVSPGDPLFLATESDKGVWNGFCEIESEPVRSSLPLQHRQLY
jgi:hypothetical protein